MIRGRKIGYATITAFSQSGSKEAEMTVRVLPKNSDKQITSILTDSESYQVMKDKYVNMSVSAEPADNTDSLIYSSSNPRVATIDPLWQNCWCFSGSDIYNGYVLERNY